MATSLSYQSGGSDTGPVLLLLHGLGANADVFDGVISEADERWPGGWVAPDLAGHGRSDWRAPYTFERHAAEVFSLLDPRREVVVLGHSMGGVVGLVLANGAFDVPVKAVAGLGIKVSWTPEDLQRAAVLASREPSHFETRDEAADRFLRVAGLVGMCTPDAPVVVNGIQELDDGEWTLAMDPRCFGVGAPDMPALLVEAQCPVILARGDHDPLVSTADLSELAPATALALQGLGHNAHVEAPAVVYNLVERFSVT